MGTFKTKSLIIFGQGLNKSHPHIYNIVESLNNNDLSKTRYLISDEGF